MIGRGIGKIAVCNVGKEYDGMYGMGIPSDLDLFLSYPVSRKATSGIGK